MILSALARAERETRIEPPEKEAIIEAMEKDWLMLNIVQPMETLAHLRDLYLQYPVISIS